MDFFSLACWLVLAGAVASSTHAYEAGGIIASSVGWLFRKRRVLSLCVCVGVSVGLSGCVSGGVSGCLPICLSVGRLIIVHHYEHRMRREGARDAAGVTRVGRWDAAAVIRVGRQAWRMQQS